MQLASGDQDSGRAIIVIVALVALGLDVEVDRIRDPLVSAARLVLVDQRGTFGAPGRPAEPISPRMRRASTESVSER